MTTIAEAKKFLRDNFEKGVDCPACGQLVRRWKHSLNSSIARTLIQMYNKGGYVHIMNEIHLTTMYAIAAYWGLIEAKEHNITDDNKKASGEWKLTPKGEAFVENRITIAKYCYVFDHMVDGFSKEQVDIEQSLGKKFDYKELINS